jgi:threo-3-hydroxy-L-aspartate ammonia-lyase
VSVTIDDVRAAAARIADEARVTPVLTSRTLDERTGASVFLKCESFQRGGAFKFRGALNALRQLSDEQRRRGVLTFSSGNHAQALALAGRLTGTVVTVVMPHDAPEVKRAATACYGAEIVLYDRDETTREALGHRLAVERGLTVVPPYDHPHIVAGQGTVALELHDQVPNLDVLLVCCGGGGLLSGCAVASKALRPGCRLIGVEPSAADDAARSFRTGTLVAVHNPVTIADGARTPSLGQVNWPIVRESVDDFVTVDDVAILRATKFLWERVKLVVEPTGALTTAALLEGLVACRGLRVGAVVSGGNADVRALGALWPEGD